MPREHIHFVTGRLAEFSLRSLLERLAPAAGFDYSVSVLGISVAALMTTAWVARKLSVPAAANRVVLPGYCQGDLSKITELTAVPVERGPKDLRELPQYLLGKNAIPATYGAYDIEILAEINYAPRLPLAELSRLAANLARDGADVIDLGCEPGEVWAGVGETVRALRGEGYRVSIDSMNPAEIEPAANAGAELVLSVNSTNVQWAADWGCPVVVVPDQPATLAGLEDTIGRLTEAKVPFRIDPVLEPIGFGFARSLGRYLAVRDRYPQAEMMMGIGNLTELTDADSAAMNVMLLGFCQELGIHSVLTTQVINWARTSVKECDLARRMARYAIHERSLPKHIEPGLVMLRDTSLHAYGQAGLDQLAGQIKDHNYRLFAEEGSLHVLFGGQRIQGTDPFELFAQLEASGAKNLDPSHSFYLGYELAKAVTALTLGKQYRQDEALDWGFLTRPEVSHRAKTETTDDDPKGKA